MSNANIVTIFDENNFGNRLQNYAMTSVLHDMGCSTAVTLKISNGTFADAKKEAKRTLGAIRHHRIKKLRLFQEFSRSLTPAIRVQPENINSLKGFFVIGSDQVWNPFFSLGGRSDGAQFAPHVPETRKLAYAASFGISFSDMPDDVRDLFSLHLRGFRYLSVREDEGAKIVENLTGRQVPVVLDPTLLIRRNEWESISKAPDIETINRPYCLKYVLGEDVNKGDVHRLAKDAGLAVVGLKDSRAPVGPSEFLYLAHHADLVCTDSFHAAVFALLFHKPLVIFERKSGFRDMSARFQTLENRFDISECFFGRKGFDEEVVFQRDWTKFEELLMEARRLSEGYLKNAIAHMDG